MSQTKQQINLSRFMSYALRHKPAEVGLKLDREGYASVHELVAAHNMQNPRTVATVQEVLDVVRTCDKQRYSVTSDQTMIRAAQGHSVDVDLSLEERVPPEVLYHGTAQRFYHSILGDGIKKMQRQHVHLSADVQTAMTVGARHGTVHILKINTARMHADGIKFWISTNGVWLTDHVDSKYLFKAIREDEA